MAWVKQIDCDNPLRIHLWSCLHNEKTKLFIMYIFIKLHARSAQLQLPCTLPAT